MAQPINVSENAFSAGAERFNQRSLAGLYAQHYQRKLAREQALDEYEKNRINRINEAGVRDQDREGLDQKVLDLKGYFSGNKDLIRKGNNAAAYEYERKIRDVLGYISESKDRTAKSTAFEKWRQERLKVGRMLTDDIMGKYESHEKAITDNDSKPLDLAEFISQSAPKYNQKEALGLFLGIKRTPGTPRYEPLPNDRFSQTEIIEEKFDPEGKSAISAIAGEYYDNNDGFATLVQENKKDPLKRGLMEKTFLQEFGTAPQTDRDYAIADMMMQIQPSIEKRKTVPNWKARQDYLQQNKERNIALNRIGRAATNEEVNDVYTRIEGKVNKNATSGFATRFNSLDNDEQEAVKKAVENAGHKTGEGGENVFLAKESDGSIKIYATSPDGKLIRSPQNELTTLSFSGVNRPVQPGVQEKRKVAEMQKNMKKDNTKPSSKTISKEDFRKKTIAERQAFLNSGGKVQ